MNKYCLELKKSHLHITKNALDLLISYPWKGNVRELENCIERSIILCEEDTVTDDHIALNRQMAVESSLRHLPADGTLEEVMKVATRIVETQRITKALKDTKGNKTKAAEILQVSYKTLLTKIRDHGIENP